MKLNRLIAVSIVGFSLLTTSTSAFACDPGSSSHSWSFFGWCSHDDKDKDHKDCDHGHNSGGGHDCNHGGSSSGGGSGSSTGSSGSSTGSGGSTGSGSGSGSSCGPKGCS